MAGPIEPQQLLDQAWSIALIEEPEADRVGTDLAEALTSIRQGVRAPLTAADYRRAISSAYFALFHGITLASASLFVPTTESRHELVRLFNHRDLKAVTGWIAGSSYPEGLGISVALLRADERVRAIAASFQQLSKAREDADYNHAVSFSQSDVRDLVRVAQNAVDLVVNPDPSRVDAAYRQRPSGGAADTPPFDEFRLEASPAGRLFLGLIALRARGGGG